MPLLELSPSVIGQHIHHKLQWQKDVTQCHQRQHQFCWPNVLIGQISPSNFGEEKGNRDSASSGDELLHVLPIKNESFLTVGNCHSQQKLGLALISTDVLAESRPAVLHLLLAPTLACISREHIRDETRTTIDNIVNRSTRDSMPMTTTKGMRMRTITIGCWTRRISAASRGKDTQWEIPESV